MKSGVLAEFITEWTSIKETRLSVVKDHWTLFFNGSLTLQGSRAGIILKSPTDDELRYVVQLNFKASNNVIEYEGLVNGLHITSSLGIKRLLVKGDSQPVVNQVQSEYQCSDDNIVAYPNEMRNLEKEFEGLELTHIRRSDNSGADEFARLTSSRALVHMGVFIEKLLKPSVPTVQRTNAAQLDQQSTQVSEAELADTVDVLLKCELT